MTYEEREANHWGEADTVQAARHCRLCDDGTDDPSGYCSACQEALQKATPEECAEDPDVAWHVANLRRFVRASATAQHPAPDGTYWCFGSLVQGPRPSGAGTETFALSDGSGSLALGPVEEVQ